MSAIAVFVICISAPFGFAQLPARPGRYLFALANASDAPPAVAPATRPGTPMDVLLAKAMKQPISVIVGFKLDPPWTPEGYLTKDAISRQRAAIDAALSSFGKRYADKKLDLQSLSPIPFLSFMADVDLLQRLDLDGDVTSIEFNFVGSGGLRQSAPLISAPSAWSLGYSGTGQTIAILDSGIDKNHPFFAGVGKIAAEACFSTPDAGASSTFCPNGQTKMFGVGSAVNCPVSVSGCSHGTHVAGIAAGSSSPDQIWGVARDANLIVIQVDHRIDDQSGCSNAEPAPCARYSFTDLAFALNYVADTLASQFHIAAVNMSLISANFFPTRAACTAASPSLLLGVGNVKSKGIAVVGVSGNNGDKSHLVLPGCITGVIDVGASTKDDIVWASSNSTSELDLLAPGSGGITFNRFITSSVPLGAPGYPYTGMEGTSMAAPHVAGALAILRQKSPLASPDTLLHDLVISGNPLTDPQNQITKPRIDVYGALNTDHTAPTPPGTLVAAATSPTSISLAWAASEDEHGVDHYNVKRRSSVSGSFATIGNIASPAYADSTVAGITTYQYLVTAVDTSGNESAASNFDLATTVLYSDDPLIVQTSPLRGADITELRSAVNSTRAFAGLSAATWTDTISAGVAVRAIDIQELRDRLGEALTAIGITAASYTDPNFTSGVTIIKAVHINELRGNVK